MQAQTGKRRIFGVAPNPMLATLIDAPFDDPDWVFETKWDGFRIIARTARGTAALYSRNGGNVTKLPIGDGDGWAPTWSPDGRQIAFYSYRPGPYYDGKPNAVYVVDVDGSNLRQLAEPATRSFHPTWRP